MIGEYCKNYRLKNNIRLKDIDNNVNLIIQFERGNSSNYVHLFKYIELSFKLGDMDTFIYGLLKIILRIRGLI